MGYVLFWLEAAITTVLFVALAGAWIARRKGKGSRVALWIATTLLTLLFWGVAITGFSLVYAFGKLGLVQLWMSSICFGLVILACIVVARRGGRRIPAADPAAQGQPANRTWRLGRLSLAFAAALLVTSMTYWNLSLAVQQQMAAAHAEAEAALQSVWPAPVAETMNADPLYRQAGEVLDSQKAWSDIRDAWYATGAEGLREHATSLPAAQPLGPILAKAAPALALVRQGAAMPQYNPNIEFRGIATLLPAFGKYRDMCRLLGLDALAAVRDGHADLTMDDVTDSFRVAGHASQTPFLIGLMISAAGDTTSVRALEKVFEIAPPTADSLSHLCIGANSPAYASFKASMKLEYASIVMTLSSTHGPADVANWLPYNPPESADFIAGIVKVNPYYILVWPEEVEAARQYYQDLISISDLPFAQWKSKVESVENSLPNRPGLLSKMLLPTLFHARTSMAIAEAQHRQAYIAKAMWLYRLKNGHFPEKLELLAPDFVPVVPKDPFTDKDMLIGHTAEGKTFLYSVGPDLKDDGGLVEVGQDKKNRDHGDIVFYLEGGRPLPASQPATKPGRG